MHAIEPFYNWQHIYSSEKDKRSPFYKRTYNEFEYSMTVYNYFIHPYWDDFGSTTLYLKILFVEYESNCAIIELIGEWNDAVENDIMTLKRDVIDKLKDEKIYKFILIAENVLNFHNGDQEYYEEWFEETQEENGWIVCLNMPEQSQYDFKRKKLHYYIELMQMNDWRTYKPHHLVRRLDEINTKRLSE